MVNTKGTKQKKHFVDSDKVAFIIPVYNEAQVVKTTIDSIPSEFKHIICVDDGSSDESLSEIEKTRATIISHPVNLGCGAATQTGVEFALQDSDIQYFVTFDADGQHGIDDVYEMLDRIYKDKVDIVLGSRFLGRTKNMPKVKKFLLKRAVWFTNKMSKVELTDTHNGFRAFNRYTAENLNLEMPGFSHASEIVDRITQKNLSYTEVPVTILYTDYSKSKGQPMINSINMIFDILLSKVVKS